MARITDIGYASNMDTSTTEETPTLRSIEVLPRITKVQPIIIDPSVGKKEQESCSTVFCNALSDTFSSIDDCCIIL
jgi:hypothetical protein